MNRGRHLRSIENKLAGPFLQERLLANVSRSVLDGFNAIGSPHDYPKGAILFTEGQDAEGVFVVSKGRVKLSTTSARGKSFLLRIAEPGEMIGLPGVISGKMYVLTSEALDPVQVNFIPRTPFLKFLRDHGEAALRVAEILNEIYHATFRELRYLALSSTATEKLARFLLEHSSPTLENKDQLRAPLSLTQEEIAEILGVARETVTRIFAAFKRDHLIEVQGPTIIIANKAGLEELMGI
ncbi:MAG: Crp/Fnr family transcriptional regulator [Acidobacteriota bacterium]|nr:Crp/Fnr family transcriptional regulator [Acidobacteriota bacterium]